MQCVCQWVGGSVCVCACVNDKIGTLRPLARLMARNGLKTRKTRRILTTEMVPDLLGVELILKRWGSSAGNQKKRLPETERNERNAHDQKIEQIESWATESAVVEHQAVRNHFKGNFDGEDRCKEIIEVVQDLPTGEEKQQHQHKHQQHQQRRRHTSNMKQGTRHIHFNTKPNKVIYPTN